MGCKFKIGDRVIGNKLPNAHGELYLHGSLTQDKVYCIEKVESGLVVVTTDDGVTSYWSEDWFKLYEEKETEMTAERIREDILHIEKRIEEAKKDITSMEQEKNALIGKLKEKGFILLNDNQPTQAYVRPSIGDLVRVIRVDEDYDEAIYLGYEFVIKKDDGTDLPYMDDCYNWFRENSVIKI